MVYEVGYNCHGAYSINMIQGEEEDVRKYATEHAHRFTYKVIYVTPLEEWEVRERKAKGMPFINLTK